MDSSTDARPTKGLTFWFVCAITCLFDNSCTLHNAGHNKGYQVLKEKGEVINKGRTGVRDRIQHQLLMPVLPLLPASPLRPLSVLFAAAAVSLHLPFECCT
jgi:hypothetical protein